ncbi:MAG: ATP-binding cassette domain-containing protein [Candidatus Helarchaeota archaeon]
MPKSYIEFRNVSKNYREIKALNNVNFKIFKGDIFGYIGPNGAGKTTTIKILVGLIQNFKGEIFIDGKNVSDYQDCHQPN